MARKKLSKKVKAKATTIEKGKGTTSEDVQVDAPADEEQATPPPAIAAEPTCYSRSKASKAVSNISGQNQHTTIAEHRKKHGIKD